MTAKRSVSKTSSLPKKTIKDAILGLKNAFENKQLTNPLENSLYFNIKTMQNLNMK